MVGNVAVETQAAKPSVGQIEVNFLTQPRLGANAEAVADDQHPDHQLRIDRGASDIAVRRSKMRTNVRKIDEPVDFTQHVPIAVVRAPTNMFRLLNFLPVISPSPAPAGPRRAGQIAISPNHA